MVAEINDTKLRKPKLKPDLTSEYIAEKRAKREARRRAKKERMANGCANQEADAIVRNSFIKRPLLSIPEEWQSTLPGPDPFKIMTYNVLAQCLIRRSLFPESGDALKWKWRGPVLAEEIIYYSPDILCLQEVDEDKYNSFWRNHLKEIGHISHFKTVRGKNHGQVISYNNAKFKLIEGPFMICYDQINTPAYPSVFQKECLASNSGMFVVLRLITNDKCNESDQKIEDDNRTRGSGLIVGTTHLLWVPTASYERSRQLYLYMSEALEIQKRHPHLPIILTGDFNSECFDMPYLSATGGRGVMTAEAKSVAIDGVIAMLENTSAKNENTKDNDVNYDDKKFRILAENYVENLITAFDNLSKHSVSLYGSVYKKLHPSNFNSHNSLEPKFSNWAHTWRGLLDYIFVLESKDSTQSDCDESTDRLKKLESVRLLELLRMPESGEMGDEPSGQPRIGMYPSDHLCMMATISINRKRQKI